MVYPIIYPLAMTNIDIAMENDHLSWENDHYVDWAVFNSNVRFTGFIQGGAPKIAKLVYNYKNCSLWYL